MTQLLAIQFALSLLAALLGAAAGWWLRGRPFAVKASPLVSRSAAANRKEFAKQALQSLHAATESVRSCVEQHIECMRAVQSELKSTSSTEPAIITSAAASIIAANGLVQHQMDDIQRAVDTKKSEISECLTGSDGLLFTFGALDRQKHVYRKVLSSLEQLAAQLVQDVEGHGRRLKDISSDIQDNGDPSLASVNGAVTQILDATEDIQRRVATTEKRIAHEAGTVKMQAILSHTDLLTSLPNRRAFEAELERAATRPKNRALCTVVFVDLDKFARVNTEYGHEGGDVVLRQAAGIIKAMLRGKDLVARYGGDSFALLLNETTLHDALPMAERIRKLLEKKEFSQGSRPLHITASLGIAQLNQQEMVEADLTRVEAALDKARNGGGNICYRHDGQSCFPVSSAFHAAEKEVRPESISLASIWRDSTNPQPATTSDATSQPAATPKGEEEPVLSGRSLFASNLNRRLAEWKRGGNAVSVAVMQVDQMLELVSRFGEQGEDFLRQVMGRLLEAATRDMDERCEFEDGLFALLLPGTDEANALAVVDRLRTQIRQCKVRMGYDLWDLTASIGLAHCTVASRVMDIMRSAEAAMQEAARLGGDAIRIGQPVPEEATA
ncbi:MAG TPA: diguanylate cyclase [Lacipirellulaceae bacterium]|nr:diguanylate cyclase [Lacipirellulaceae bacterium]